MPSTKAHLAIGAAVGAGAWFVYCRLTNRGLKLSDLLVAAGTGACVAILPDLLEPALHPHHRSFFHSMTTASLLVWGTQKVWENPSLTRDQKMHCTVSTMAYASHLLADGCTPKGIPPLL